MEKKLTKSNDRIIAGVCQGIADYFDWNVKAVRIIWGLLSLCYGAGILVYIIAAILMPNE